ncbi:hypothetical protein C8R47DRAFT_978251, partial [Mycena vitilis]
TLRPVTIAQIRKATQSNSDSDWLLDETAIGQVTVVAELLAHNAFTTNRTFSLDDGTGRIDAKMWIDTADKPLLNAPSSSRLEPMYVRVTGSIKTFHDRRHIHASNVRAVSDPNEVYFHLLETITVFITLKHGPPVPRAAEGSTASGLGAYLPPAPATARQKPLFSAVADAVVNYLRNVEARAEGAHVGDIAKALDADAVELSETVNRLIDEGHVFTTVDESHIQLAE